MVNIWTFLKPGIPFQVLAGFFLLFHAIETTFFPFSFDVLALKISQLPSAKVGAVLFAAAILETIFVFGYYFPGSLVLFVAYYLFYSSPDFFKFACLTWTGVIIGSCINYLLGLLCSRFISLLGHKAFIDKTKMILERFGAFGFAGLSAHPNYCGTGFLVLGLLKIRPWKSILVAASFGALWIFIWTGIFSRVGQIPNMAEDHSYYVAGGLSFIGLAISTARHISRRSNGS